VDLPDAPSPHTDPEPHPGVVRASADRVARTAALHRVALHLRLRALVPVTGAGITAMELTMSGAAESRSASSPGAGARCDMGSLRADLMPAHLVQMSLPVLQDLPLLAPLPESPSTELITATEVALTKLPFGRDVLSEPAPAALQPQAVQLMAELRSGVRRPGSASWVGRLSLIENRSR